MSPLAFIGQEDFAAGILRSTARGMEPGVGVFNAVNGFFDDDGDCYLRGGTTRFSATVAPGTDPLLQFFWAGDLNGETVILAATQDQYFRVSPGSRAFTALTTGPGAGSTYPTKPAVVGGEIFFSSGAWFQTTPGYPGTMHGAGAAVDNWYPADLPGNVDTGAVHVCACANRLIYASGRAIRFSSFDATGKPTPHVFSATDYHELPEGTVVTGVAAIRDTVLVFTTYGIWTITNLALDLTDDYGNPQQELNKILPEISLHWLAGVGIAEWEGRLVVPCTDQIYLMDTSSAPTPIANSILPLYRDYLNGVGTNVLAPGGAKVYRNHYFLPMINGAGYPEVVLACRLNRPVAGRMTYYPWTRLEGDAARMVMADILTIDSMPELLVAADDGWVLSFRELFGADHSLAPLDADGTAPVFELETRDFPTGNGQPNHVRELRVNYTLSAAAGVTPQMNASVSFGNPGTPFGDPGDWVDLPDIGPPSPGIDPIRWHLPQAKRARYVRARVRCDDAVERLTIHSVQLGIRPATHQR